jgi:hypothetical protein
MTDVWNETGEEVFGSTPGMVWMINRGTGKKALFKPDTGKLESKKELFVSKLCYLLDVSCVKVELFEHCGKPGILSHDYKTQKRFRTCDAHCLHRSGEKISSITLTIKGYLC